MAGDGRSSLRRNARKSSACSPPADRRPRSPDCSRRTARRSAGSTLRRVKPRQSELPGSRYVRKFGRKSTDRVLGPTYVNLKIAAPEFGPNWLRCRLVKLEHPAEDGATHIVLWEPRDR